MVEIEPRYPSATRIFRISQSSLETYLRCGLWYLYDRSVTERRATVRMLVGSAVAEGATHDDKEKMRHGSAAKPRDVIDRSVVSYEAMTAVTEIPESLFEVRGGVDQVRKAALAYTSLVSPEIAPDTVIASEEVIVTEIDPGLELVGTPDVVTKTALRDRKVGQPWTKERVDASRQLTAYSILHEAQYGSPPRSVAVDSIHRVRGNWGAVTLWSSRTPEDHEAFVETLRRVRKSIRAGVFLPAPEASWWCSPRWCPHWKSCPAVAGRRSRHAGD